MPLNFYLRKSENIQTKDEKMKIAIDCRMSGCSGIGTFLDGILDNIISTGNEFILIGLKNKISAPNVQNIDCSVKMFSVKEMFFFPKAIRNIINTADVFFTPYCNIPCGIKVPVFSTIHDVVFLDVKGLAGKAGTLVRKFFYQRAINKSRAVITVSQFSKNRIIANLKCSKEIFVVYNGLPSYLENFTPSETKKTDTVIFIGNIKKHKGLPVLLNAYPDFYKNMQEKNISPKLLITGSSENFRTKDNGVLSLIEKINSQCNSSIEFTGWVSDEKLRELLCCSKVLVQPSLYEGFGIPPLQALKCRTRALISDIPVFKEIYSDLPVDFFKSEDSKDLAEKLASSFTQTKPLPDLPEKYSYKKTAEYLLQYFNYARTDK